MADFVVKNLKEIEAAMAEIPNKVARKVLRTSMRKALKPMQQSAKQNAPEGETDTLEKSLKIRAGKKSRTMISVNLETTAKDDGEVPYHSAFVEYGTSKQRPQGFLRRAFDSTANTTRGIAEADILVGIMGVVREVRVD